MALQSFCCILAVSWSYTQSVGLLGRGIGPSQGRYLHTGQHKHIHPRLEWDSNPRPLVIYSLSGTATVIHIFHNSIKKNIFTCPCPELDMSSIHSHALLPNIYTPLYAQITQVASSLRSRRLKFCIHFRPFSWILHAKLISSNNTK
jgi:hypothetical protein